MFDLGWSEFLIVSAVAIVVVGPKEIPRVLKIVSGGIRKARSYAYDFQRSVMDIADMDDLNDIRKSVIAEKDALQQDMKDATADMDAIRKDWEMDWDAELQKTTDDINAELGVEHLQQQPHDFLKPKGKGKGKGKHNTKKAQSKNGTKSKTAPAKTTTSGKKAKNKKTSKKSSVKKSSVKKTLAKQNDNPKQNDTAKTV